MSVKIDYESIPRSYRDYLELMEKEGEYLAINDEVDWDLEIGAICRRADETISPSPIFNKVKDTPGFRAAEWGFTKSGTPGRPWCRVAPNVGASPETTLIEILEAYMHSVENNPVHPPKIVENKDAPCKENKWVGDEIDLLKLPVDFLKAGLSIAELLQLDGLSEVGREELRYKPSSIRHLRPDSAFLKATLTLPVAKRVTYHSIIGRADPKDPIPESTDEVVPYWSSHLDGAASEDIVHATHTTITANPEAMEAVRRILYLHIGRKSSGPLPALDSEP